MSHPIHGDDCRSVGITAAGIYVVERCRYLAAQHGGQVHEWLEVAGKEWGQLSAAQQAVFAGDDRVARAATVAGLAVSYACPVCLAVSYNAHDAREGYCGECHNWTREAPGGPGPAGGSIPPASPTEEP